MLKSKEVCELIKFCGEAGVSQLKWGDLQVDFRPKKPETPQEIPDTEISEQIEQSGRSRLTKEELREREDELDHMLVENPAKYEELVLAGELENDSGTLDGGTEKT